MPVECVVRGYLVGSGWSEYQKQRNGRRRRRMPEGMTAGRAAARAAVHPGHQSGHRPRREHLRATRPSPGAGPLWRGPGPGDRDLHRRGRAPPPAGASSWPTPSSSSAWIAGLVVLVDEILTPDSSRFWPAEEYKPGTNPPSFDKQYVRGLADAGWDRQAAAAPPLPEEVITGTRTRYLEAYERITGQLRRLVRRWGLNALN